jgi:hypothetical protein
MSAERLGKGTLPVRRRPVGVRWLAYWCGRTLQALGLVLIVEVLLLFAGTPGMGALLEWSAVAALVFYAGWACTTWAKGTGAR